MLTSVAYAVENIPILSKINTEIVNPIIQLLIAAAVVVFIYGMIQMVRGEDDARNAGKRHALWGIIGIFIMVSVFGILNVICNTIGCN